MESFWLQLILVYVMIRWTIKNTQFIITKKLLNMQLNPKMLLHRASQSEI